MPNNHVRLGVNIDHVATVRNARGTFYPDPVAAAKLAITAGADGITAHLREDRRHIRDADIEQLSNEKGLRLNLEMAATEEMQQIALLRKPEAICLVPENRLELTTEGGLDVINNYEHLKKFIRPLRDINSAISIFSAPDKEQIDAAFSVGASVVELHTGEYCDAHHARQFKKKAEEFKKIASMAKYAHSIGLEVHAGHGICLETVEEISSIPEIVELNIGHALIADSIFMGLNNAIGSMRVKINASREKKDNI